MVPIRVPAFIQVSDTYELVFRLGTAGARSMTWVRIDPPQLRFPLLAEPRQAGLAGEELLHGGLFEVALLGDERVELSEQGIHIRQRGGDGALFGESRRGAG